MNAPIRYGSICSGVEAATLAWEPLGWLTNASIEETRRYASDADFSALEVELADAVIRIMDYAHARSLDLAGAILAKMKYNRTRPMRHGGKRF